MNPFLIKNVLSVLFQYLDYTYVVINADKIHSKWCDVLEQMDQDKLHKQCTFLWLRNYLKYQSLLLNTYCANKYDDKKYEFIKKHISKKMKADKDILETHQYLSNYLKNDKYRLEPMDIQPLNCSKYESINEIELKPEFKELYSMSETQTIIVSMGGNPVISKQKVNITNPILLFNIPVPIYSGAYAFNDIKIYIDNLDNDITYQFFIRVYEYEGSIEETFVHNQMGKYRFLICQTGNIATFMNGFLYRMYSS